jgi:hypothetical protein
VSAFIVDRADIDVLVTGLNAVGLIGPGVCDEIGRMLWRENLRSLQHLYPNDRDGQRPGPIDFRDSDVDTYEWTPNAAGLDPVQLRETAHTYGYQSCEHPGWAESTAATALAALAETEARLT